MSFQSQLSLFEEVPDPRMFLDLQENQWFERKSFRISAAALADHMIGFANADGGRIVVGIHNGQFEGMPESEEKFNSLLQASLDFTQPPVRHRTEDVELADESGMTGRMLVFDIEASEVIHRNRKLESFIRVGDENRRLGPVEERELAFDKGESVFDQTLAPGVSLQDLDPNLVEEYQARAGAKDGAALLRARGLLKSVQEGFQVTQAGWLVLGKQAPIWSYVRYVRHLGTKVEVGERSNVLEDVTLQGNIPSLITQAQGLLRAKIGAVTRMTSSGRFEAVPLVPEEVWLEAVVNAVTHRSYSLQGDGVRIREFDDRLEVESPGRLPGLVRVKNIRETRYARNPHIARAMAEMTGFVRELNEGVNRMFEVMARVGLQAPRYEIAEGSVKVILYKRPNENWAQADKLVSQAIEAIGSRVGPSKITNLLLRLKAEGRLRTGEVGEILGVSVPTARRHMRQLESLGLAQQVLKSSTDPTRYWSTAEHPFWARVRPEDLG